MKKILLLLVLFMVSCSSDEQPTVEPEQTCYRIIARGFDGRGDYIIVKYGNYDNKRFAVSNYMDYLNQTEICEPINLTEQQL